MKQIHFHWPLFLLFWLLLYSSTATAQPLQQKNLQAASQMLTPPCFAVCNNLVNQSLPIDTTAILSYGKTNPANYHDPEYPDDCGVDKNDTICLTNAAAELRYQAYFPANSVYSKAQYNSCPLPVMILFHPGGFSDCSGAFGNNAYDTVNAQMPKYCMDFARRGFVAINVEYRRGQVPTPDSTYSVQQMLIYYMAFQDGRGMLRTAIHNQRNATSNDKFQIDTNWIFVGGASAGAAISMHLGYYPTQAMNDQIFLGLRPYMGTLNQDYYVGDTTINYFDRIKGVMCLWGNGFLPLAYNDNPEDFFENNSNFPALIAFQGKLDKTAKYRKNDVFFAPEPEDPEDPNYYSISNCLRNGGTYSFPGDPDKKDLLSIGPDLIYQYFGNLLTMEYYLDCDMGHGLDEDPCTSPPHCYKTNFGTVLNNKFDVRRYIVQRSATYFQAIINNIANTLNDSKFVDCENYRSGCSTTDNNAGCSNNNSCQ